MAAPLRLPLVSGRTSWEDRVRFTAALIPLLVVTSVVFAVWVPLFDGLSDLPLVGSVFAILQFTPVFAMFALLAVAVKSRAHARANRPSDLVIRDDRIEIHGGALHGTVLDRAELATVRCYETRREDRGFVEALRELFTDRRVQESCVTLQTDARSLAEAISPDEQRTVRAVHQMLQELASTPAAAAGAPVPGPGRTVEEVTCARCGAPVSPDDRAEVACPACKATVAMPDPVRERVRVGRLATDVSALRKRAVTDMTSLPGARTTAIALTILGWLMLLAWPALLLGPWLSGIEPSLTLMIVVLAVGIGLDVAIYYAVLPRFIVRQAFPVTLRQFAARAGAQDLACCRQCSAPLPASQATVVRCAFCGTDNLLGRDLVLALPGLAHEAGALEPAARAWRDDRRRSRVASAIAATLLVAGAVVAVRVVPGLRIQSLTRACEGDDASACRALGAARWRPLLDARCYHATDQFACMALGVLEVDPAAQLRAAIRLCALRNEAECSMAKLTCMTTPALADCAPYRKP